jgi:hypothetical protein
MNENIAKEFDYRTAWREAAKPAFDALDPELKLLLTAVTCVASGLVQNDDCSMPWPDDKGVTKNRFAAFNDKALATASQIVSCYGHWAPLHMRSINEHGGMWKFSLYCDQVLAKRMNVDSVCRNHGPGIWYRVCGGALVICVTIRLGTRFEEEKQYVLLATRDNLEKVRKALAPALTKLDGGWVLSQSDWEKLQEEIRVLLPDNLLPLRPDKYLVPTGTLKAQDDAAREAEADTKFGQPDKFKEIVEVVENMRKIFGDRSDREVNMFLTSLTFTSKSFKERVLTEADQRAKKK